jgi:hypothetical protein
MTRKHDVSEPWSISIFRWGKEDRFPVGSLRRTKFNHCLSKGPNRVGVSFPSLENANRPNFRNVIFSSYFEFRTMYEVHTHTHTHTVIVSELIWFRVRTTQKCSFVLPPLQCTRISMTIYSCPKLSHSYCEQIPWRRALSENRGRNTCATQKRRLAGMNKRLSNGRILDIIYGLLYATRHSGDKIVPPSAGYSLLRCAQKRELVTSSGEP